MIFSKKWKEKSCPETGFEPQTFEFKDHCLIHYSTGTMMEARKKSFEVKIISLFVTNRYKGPPPCKLGLSRVLFTQLTAKSSATSHLNCNLLLSPQ